MREHRAHFITAQHHRQPRRLARPQRAVEPPQLFLEKLLIQKQQRAEGLVLRRRRYFPLYCQVTEKLNDLFFAELARMPFTMKQNETANPIHIRLLSAPAVASRAHKSAHLIKEFGLAPCGSMGWNRAQLNLLRFCSDHDRFSNRRRLAIAIPN